MCDDGIRQRAAKPAKTERKHKKLTLSFPCKNFRKAISVKRCWQVYISASVSAHAAVVCSDVSCENGIILVL
jgi:hypothetical protein